MTHFSLSITSSYFTVDSLIVVKLNVLFSAHEFDVLDEHAEMDPPGHLMRTGHPTISIEVIVVDLSYSLEVVVQNQRYRSVGIHDDVFSGLIEKVGSVGQRRPSFKMPLQGVKVLLPVDEVRESLSRDGGLLSFLFKGCFHVGYDAIKAIY